MSSRGAVSTDLSFALVPEWLLDADVSAQAIRLYAVLSRYADRDGNAYPSRKLLAERLKVRSKDTVDRALKELVDAHALTIRGRVDEAGDQTSNHYIVHRTAPEGVAARIGPPHPTEAATGPHESGGGGRTDAATVAAQIVHEREPLELELPPKPPHSGGAEPTSTTTTPPRCARHTTPAANCRGCGTTNRQIAARLAAEKAERRREADRAATEAERARKAAAKPLPPDLKADLRAQLRTAREAS